MLLSTAYLGNIQYFSKLATGRGRIEACEHFQKQTYRNRAHIMTAGGVRPLTVPVIWNHGRKMPIRDVRIDYTLPWQREHWRTLQAAYASSPYFDHYSERFIKYYEDYRPEFLWDWNSELTHRVLETLGLPQELHFTETYLPPLQAAAQEDFRDSISHKPRLCRDDPDFTAPRYYQVFQEQQPFAENLSVIDLLFCEGPLAGAMVKQSYTGAG